MRRRPGGSRVLLFGLMLVAITGLTAGCGKHHRQALPPQAPRTVKLGLGVMRRFNAADLPAHSIIVCAEGKTVNRFIVPRWSSWDRQQGSGWFASGTPGTGEGWLGVRPAEHGTVLIAWCRR